MKRGNSTGSLFKRSAGGHWILSYFTHEGRRIEKSSGTTDWATANRMLARLTDLEAQRKQGLIDPQAERMAKQRVRPLGEHFSDYEEHLSALQRDDRHIAGTLRYLRKVSEALQWRTLASIDAHALTTYLSVQAEKRDSSPRTFNAAVTAWKAFGRWCSRTGRLTANPVANIGMRNVESDRRRVRRDLTPDELARIIDVAAKNPMITIQRPERDAEKKLKLVPVRMNYPDRQWSYRIAAGTGFRASEVSSLTPASFDLNGDTPTITVEAAFSKRKRRDVQPIRADLAVLLKEWLKGKAEGEPVCPLPDGKAGQLLKHDVALARAQRIAEATTEHDRVEREKSDYLRQTDSTGAVVDFHGLRVHFISRVVEAGANVKEAMERLGTVIPS